MLITLAVLGAIALLIGAIFSGAVRAILAFVIVVPAVVVAAMFGGVWDAAPAAVSIVALIAGAITAISVPWPQRTLKEDKQ